MNFTVKTKSLIFSCITALLSMFVFTSIDMTVPVVAIIAQIGFYAAVTTTSFSPWQLSVPVVSYGIAFMICGNPLLALLSLVYVPASAVIALCLRKKVSRSATVVLSSLTVGITALICGLVWALNCGVELSADGISALIKDASNHITDLLVGNIPDAMFENGISKEVYRQTIFELFSYFSLGMVVLACNVIAFFSTAVTKLVVPFLGAQKNMSSFAKKWNFVLSKQSALMYLICYLCLIVGGETLTLPQQIAFNTVFVAIQGGILIMAFRFMREKMAQGGSYLLVFCFVLAFFLGIPVFIIILSFIGIFAAFKQKTKEGK